MYSTAKNYGLKINSYVDERLDPVKAADAAARYLRDAYSIFGDWSLAISAYNCGAGNVNKAIRRAGGNKNFWAIYEYLPRETRGYVPAFVGAMYAFTYYKEHGIIPEPITIPSHLDTFAIRKNLHFAQINGVINVPVDMLKELNPQYSLQGAQRRLSGPHRCKIPCHRSADQEVEQSPQQQYPCWSATGDLPEVNYRE